MGADNWEASEIQMCVDLVGDTITAAISYACCKDKNNRVCKLSEMRQESFLSPRQAQAVSMSHDLYSRLHDWSRHSMLYYSSHDQYNSTISQSENKSKSVIDVSWLRLDIVDRPSLTLD